MTATSLKLKIVGSILLLLHLSSCSLQSDQPVEKHKEIVIVNLQEGDREFIAEMLLNVNTCEPRLIVLDAFFREEKDPKQDSILASALGDIEDIFLINAKEGTEMSHSHSMFLDSVRDAGFVNLQATHHQPNFFQPVIEVRGERYEHAALKVRNFVNPDQPLDFEPEISLKIDYQNNLDGFHYWNGEDIDPISYKDSLRDKIVLVGYLGPSFEDKHSVMHDGHTSEDPNMYGVVIIANILQQLLEATPEDFN